MRQILDRYGWDVSFSGFDPEVAAGYQDADIEMAEAADAANAAADAHFDDAYYGYDEDDKEQADG